MTRRQFWQLVSILFTSVCCTWLSSPARADEPAGTVRYFLEFPWDGELHDWEADGNRRLVLVPSRDPHFAPGPEQFGAPDWISTFPFNYQIRDSNGVLLLDLSNTIWVRASVLQINAEGVEYARWVYWLVTAPSDGDDVPEPPTGAIAKAGLDGDIEVLAEVSLATLSDSSWNIVPFGGGYPVRFSRGVFSK